MVFHSTTDLPGSRARRFGQAAVSFSLFLLLLIYITSFWGQAGRYLPWPVDNWYYLPYRAIVRWSERARTALQSPESITLYAGAEAFLLGFMVPAAFALGWRRPLRDFGMGWPDIAGWCWTAAGVTLSLPVGRWITALVPPPGNETEFVVRMLAMLPEHFLIFGIGIAVMLPDKCLPDQSSISHTTIGLRSPLRKRRGVGPNSGIAAARPVGTVGISLAPVLAIAGATVLFVAVHVGARSTELAFSVAFGLLCAYVTWRTASIWPALIVHWSLNLAPLALRFALA